MDGYGFISTTTVAEATKVQDQVEEDKLDPHTFTLLTVVGKGWGWGKKGESKVRGVISALLYTEIKLRSITNVASYSRWNPED